MNWQTPMRANAEATVLRLVLDIAPIGSVTYGPRLNGFAVFEDDVMFGYVEADGTIYLRTTPLSGACFQKLGSTKHPEMPYWSLPAIADSNREVLQQLAYEAADNAHLAHSFDIDDDQIPGNLFLAKGSTFSRVMTYAMLAA